MAMNTASGDEGVLSEINVTPMVDVMLVLLIIFMVVTPAIVAGFQAEMPVGVHLKPRPEEDGRTVLGIDRHGAYYLNKQPVGGCTAADRGTPDGRTACAQTIVGLLAAEFQAHPDDRVLFVKADRTLKYNEMLVAMDLARDAGARVVAAITEQQPGTEPEDDEG